MVFMLEAKLPVSHDRRHSFSAREHLLGLKIVTRTIFVFLLTAFVIWSGSLAGADGIGPLPGMPPVLDANDIYSATRPGNLSPALRGFPNLVYVPNSGSNTVDVIDQHTFKIVDHFKVGRQPQHVTPAYDLKTLWVLNDQGDSLTKIDPATGKKGDTVPVKDPYNMYYTPDGKYAIVVAEALRRLDFRDPTSMALVASVTVACRGIDHIDFSADGRYLIASCEFTGTLVKLDVSKRAIVGTLALPPHGDAGAESAAMAHDGSRMAMRRAYDRKESPSGSMPQDVKLSPDGKVFYVADMLQNGVHLIDGEKLVSIGFIPTGRGTHGLYPSRDSRFLYVSNRDEGSVSLISFAERKVVQKWMISGGGSPDMGGVSADGKVLWLSGRYDSEIYALDTADGHLLARIPVGNGPHGLCVYPQPGRYSLGHTGILR
jgi:YVTN family beta-propeller protein